MAYFLYALRTPGCFLRVPLALDGSGVYLRAPNISSGCLRCLREEDKEERGEEVEMVEIVDLTKLQTICNVGDAAIGNSRKREFALSVATTRRGMMIISRCEVASCRAVYLACFEESRIQALFWADLPFLKGSHDSERRRSFETTKYHSR